jgi:hypothetical protein
MLGIQSPLWPILRVRRIRQAANQDQAYQQVFMFLSSHVSSFSRKVFMPAKIKKWDSGYFATVKFVNFSVTVPLPDFSLTRNIEVCLLCLPMILSASALRRVATEFCGDVYS